MPVLRCDQMNSGLKWTWLLVSGSAVILGSWFLTGDALVVVIASIVWLVISGWFLSRLDTSWAARVEEDPLRASPRSSSPPDPAQRTSEGAGCGAAVSASASCVDSA